MHWANANANNANARIIKWRLYKTLLYGAWFAIRLANQNWGTFFPQEITISQQALKMGVKVPGTKYSFWCERDIRGTNGTKREKYGEKYSGVNAANEPFICS